MKRIVVLSGKGGTGKTSVTAALAHLASRSLSVVLVDADVDAANLGIVTAPVVGSRHVFEGGKVAVVDAARCEGRGECVAACRFGAVPEAGRIDETACEGCAACLHRCPNGAIAMRAIPTGEWFESDTRFGPLYHARLHPGRENSGKLVTEVRRAAEARAERDGADLVLVDGPPGIGCPVIAASAGADLALLVTEPSLSAAEDLERALLTVRHFGIPALAVVNKADLGPDWAERIERRCGKLGVEVAGRIPFDPEVTRAMVRRETITESGDGRTSESLARLWSRLEDPGLARGGPEHRRG